MNMSPTTRTASKKHIYRNFISSFRDRIDKEFNLKYQVVVITSLSSALRDVLFFWGLTSIFSHSQQLDNVSIQFNFTTPPPASGDLALQTKQYTPSTMEGSNTILNNRTNWENTSEKGEFVLTVWTPATDKGICFTFLIFCTDSKLLSKFINYFTATRKTKKKNKVVLVEIFGRRNQKLDKEEVFHRLEEGFEVGDEKPIYFHQTVQLCVLRFGKERD